MSLDMYDLAVIGGGSGGMAMAKEAAKAGAKVAIFDFVKPSTQGTKWGLGGTCVNVGCVPKKLFHYASQMGDKLKHDAHQYGWNFTNSQHSWTDLLQTVQNHVKSLNFSYRVGLRSSQVEYINGLAKFTDKNTIEYTTKSETKSIQAKHICIATGGRPHIPMDVPGAREYAITSDDLFSLPESPGKTLVVGASYIALECGGFLTGLRNDVTVCVRSILLRGFDRQCSEKIGVAMEEFGTKFLRSATPKAIAKTADGRLQVSFNGAETDIYDTVLYATGRNADTAGLNLECTGVRVEENGKIKCAEETTNIENIHAIGDVLYGRPELTPVAIRAGEMLARRLFASSEKKMNYDNIPTAIFTPVEYGCCGLSEDNAILKYGVYDIETYLFEFTNLEIAAAHREIENKDENMSPSCLCKLVCRKSKNDLVLGIHFVGNSAGEIIQGMSLALNLGVTKEDFNHMIGIHPTDAEAFVSMDVTRASGESWLAAGGCGGGKCG